ncbi:glycoside hydrolase family 9 protein [Massilibacteroides sp.]|uniref:glycoside hydrolase family 9 protein n=1 Tax=Massilibacteroides sp. TaxID=2034766 RepID=UPI00261CB12A|nr:glycoside hydrolase family 9 protein [Massilibacteroides sp.]MDD4516032.1 glycoside hydrolase family 9 protein [Massilibacteroides sp.]
MKNLFLIIALISSLHSLLAQESAWIRVNQLGYLPDQTKVAVFITTKEGKSNEFILRDAKTNEMVYQGVGKVANAERWGMKQALRLNFSSLKKKGGYYIECNGRRSPFFRIAPEVYDGTADFLLKYMRQQRCGYNPYLNDVCHQHDGFIVYHPERTGEKIDVRGGWHDASDYLQYLPTSANATFQMMFAWQQNPDTAIFKDEYGDDGRKGKNGIPDILDEIRWGLEWMERMNPDSAIMFNQIADDRDHAKMRLPNKDSIDYGWSEGKGRPVYFVTGERQGLGKHKNRTTGVASTAGKFASAFALGADIFKKIDPDFASRLIVKSSPAFHFGEARPGNTQTACTVSPYFYEEDNYVDDMELAAAVKYELTNDTYWLKKADYWGILEEVTPWMELGRARHYQFYPFVNLGHYYLAKAEDKSIAEKYIRFMRSGLDCLLKRAKANDDPFLYGIPFIWCSNNLVAAAITQANLYKQLTGDDTYVEMESALRDWLLGCNPWGTSMICGLPAGGDFPSIPHSAYVDILNDIPYGGLVDGLIYKSIYEALRGIHLKNDDPYALFQSGAAVYHDDPGDYSSNEPTMDGTASLSFYFSQMESDGHKQTKRKADSVKKDISLNDYKRK